MATRESNGLVGRTSPLGRYRIDPADHRRFVEATAGGDVFDSSHGAPAHPSYGHLASHCGMGWSFEDLLAVVEAVPEDAVVFGRGTFEFRQPLRIGTTYEVRSTITQVEPRYGRRVGTFDAITVTHELWPSVGGPRITTTETYIVPRPGGPSAPTPSAPSPPLIRSPQPASERHRVAFGPVRQEDIMTVMEVMGDTNPVHLDRDMALAAGYRGPVNQGPSNLAYVFTAIAGWRGDLHGLRYVDFTFHATVTEGDRPEVQLSAQGTDVLGDLVVADDVRALSCRCTFG